MRETPRSSLTLLTTILVGSSFFGENQQGRDAARTLVHARNFAGTGSAASSRSRPRKFIRVAPKVHPKQAYIYFTASVKPSKKSDGSVSDNAVSRDLGHESLRGFIWVVWLRPSAYDRGPYLVESGNPVIW
jgi:hypothetical protein